MGYRRDSVAVSRDMGPLKREMQFWTLVCLESSKLLWPKFLPLSFYRHRVWLDEEVRGFAKGWFPKGWFWRMFPRNENRNEGTFAKTTLLRNRPFISQWEVTGRHEVTTTFFYVWPLWCAWSFSGCEWAYYHGTLLCEFSIPKCGGVLGGNDQNRAEKQNVVLTWFRPLTWSSGHLGRRF